VRFPAVEAHSGDHPPTSLLEEQRLTSIRQLRVKLTGVIIQAEKNDPNCLNTSQIAQNESLARTTFSKNLMDISGRGMNGSVNKRHGTTMKSSSQHSSNRCYSYPMPKSSCRYFGCRLPTVAKSSIFREVLTREEDYTP
jgi:hypothetical protein